MLRSERMWSLRLLVELRLDQRINLGTPGCELIRRSAEGEKGDGQCGGTELEPKHRFFWDE